MPTNPVITPPAAIVLSQRYILLIRSLFLSVVRVFLLSFLSFLIILTVGLLDSLRCVLYCLSCSHLRIYWLFIIITKIHTEPDFENLSPLATSNASTTSTITRTSKPSRSTVIPIKTKLSNFIEKSISRKGNFLLNIQFSIIDKIGKLLKKQEENQENQQLIMSKKLEHAIAKRMCGVGIIICGLLLLSVALIMGLEFPKFVYKKNLLDLCILNTNHRLYEKWVKDKFRDKFNRLYYWEITNADDFLYNGASPQFVERGPYVYREHEEKHDVRFSYSSVDFHLRKWQVFSGELTETECGDNCTENDQITLLNPHYFGQVGKYGGDTNYALLFVPETVESSITDVTLLTNTNFTGAMSFFGKVYDTTLDPLLVDLGYPETFSQIGFGSWLNLQDTNYKQIVYNHRGPQDFTSKEMAGLFTVITNPALLGATKDLLARSSKFATECDVNSNSRILFAVQDLQGAGLLQYDTKPSACSFLACLAKYMQLQRQVVQTRGELPNVTDCIARYLCMNNATACFTLPINPFYQSAYIYAVHDYITEHWARYALYRAVHVLNQDLIVTRPQSQLALGYYLVNETEYDGDLREQFVPGILEHTSQAADVRWKSKKISLYNCYDATEASTNFFWKGYDGQLAVDEQQFPNATALDRRIYSYRRNVPPVQEIIACEDALLKEEPYFFFLPDFWRKMQFWPTEIKYIGEKIVNVMRVNQSMFMTDEVYISEAGLQPMEGTYGFLSWLSLPHFLYADGTGLEEQYNTSPSEDRHSLQMAVEPVTGIVWESCIRYQLNVGLMSKYTTVERPTSINVQLNGRPLPVYWVDSYFLFNQEGQAEYEDRAGRLLRAACGGMVGMSTISGFFMLFGLLAATIRIRSRRVAPTEVSEGL